MVDTKGWGRSKRVSRMPLTKPASVLTARPAMISSGMLVMPKFWTSTPMVQVHSTQLEPTDRSMPGGNQGAQHAGGDQAVDGSLFEDVHDIADPRELIGHHHAENENQQRQRHQGAEFCKSSFRNSSFSYQSNSPPQAAFMISSELKCGVSRSILAMTRPPRMTTTWSLMARISGSSEETMITHLPALTRSFMTW